MTLSIGEVSRLTGLSIHTLRYYDELGLFPQVERAKNGHRVFGEHILSWIYILKCLRATQMSLSDMKCFTDLAYQEQNIDIVSQQRELLEFHRLEVERRMVEVKAAIKLLDEKIQHFRKTEEEQSDQGDP